MRELLFILLVKRFLAFSACMIAFVGLTRWLGAAPVPARIPAEQGSAHVPAFRPELDNDQFSHNGFQGADTADGSGVPPRTYRATDGALAILSDSCEDWRASSSCDSYTEVDAFVAFDDRVSQDEVVSFTAMHPWYRGRYADHVLTYRLRNKGEFAAWTRQLARNCQVIRHAFISSHGSPGILHFHEGSRETGTMSVQDALSSGLGCLLVPGSRVQFDGCQLACGDQASRIRTAIQAMVGSPDAEAPRNGTPYDQARFLFNTADGVVRSSISNFFLGSGWNWNPSIVDENNGAVMYTVSGNQVRADVPVDSVRACTND